MQKTIIADKQQMPFDWVNISFLAISPLIAVIGTSLYAWHYGVTKLEIGLFFAMYFATGLAITAGYHRYYSHLTYKASKPLELFYLIFGAAAVENSVINWCSDHRYHHRFVDTDEDPYNILRGGLYAHMGWIFRKNNRNPVTRFDNVPDLRKNALVVWQHKHYLKLVVIVGFVLPFLVGLAAGRPLGGLLWGGFLRCVVVQHMTFFINSLAHLYGERPYSDTDTARDSWWLGLFTFGEGYHNFHHKFQADYRNGIKWYHFDLAKWWPFFMKQFGQADRFSKMPDHLILKAKLEVQARAIARRLEAAQAPQRMWEMVQNRMTVGQKRFEESYAQYQLAKLEYKRRRAEWSADVRRQWALQVKNHRAELDEASRRWHDFVRAMHRIPVPSRANSAFSLAFAFEILKYKIW